MFDSNQSEDTADAEIKRPSKRGGARSGAGRKKGDVGRFRRLINERSKRAAEQSTTPLEYMLKVLNDPMIDQKRRDAMAIAAAPYIHPRLAATELSGKLDVSHEDKLKALE